MKRIILLALLFIVLAGCVATTTWEFAAPISPLPAPVEMPTHIDAYQLYGDTRAVNVTCAGRQVVVLEQLPDRVMVGCHGPTLTPTTIFTPTATLTITPTPTALLTPTIELPTVTPTPTPTTIVTPTATAQPTATETPMAIANPTLLTGGNSATDPMTSASFSISPNALVLVDASFGGAVNSGDPVISDSFGANLGDWTKYTAHPTDTTNNQWTGAMWVALAGPSGGTGTVTVDSGTSGGTRNNYQVFEVVSGFDTLTPVRQSKRGEGSAGGATFALTLDSSPLADSLVFAMISARVNESINITHGSGFTELGEQNNGATGGNGNTQQTQYKNGSATTTVDWSGLTGTDRVAVAIEIVAAATGQPLMARRRGSTMPIGAQRVGRGW